MTRPPRRRTGTGVLLTPGAGAAQLWRAADEMPELTEADVVMLLQPSTWMRHHGTTVEIAARHTCFVAFAALAGVGTAAAARITPEQWTAHGAGRFFVRRRATAGLQPAMPLLTATVAHYLNFGPGERPRLLLSGNRPVLRSQVLQAYARLGRRLNLRMAGLPGMLLRFFARQFNAVAEEDRNGVAALMGIRHVPFTTQKITEKPGIERLEDMIRENHVLTGDARQFMLPDAVETILRTKPRNLRDIPVRTLSHAPALEDDRVVKELLDVEWPRARARRERLSRKLAAEHFDHLYGLVEAKRLGARHMGMLLGLGREELRRSLNNMRNRENRANRRTPAPRPARMPPDMRTRILDLWQNRRSGETPFRFGRRIAAECPPLKANAATLVVRTHLRAATQRRRGRPRKPRGA